MQTPSRFASAVVLSAGSVALVPAGKDHVATTPPDMQSGLHLSLLGGGGQEHAGCFVGIHGLFTPSHSEVSAAPGVAGSTTWARHRGTYMCAFII